MRAFTLLVAIFAFGMSASMPACAQAPEQEEQKVLIFTKTNGWRHASIPDGVQMMRELGEEHDFAVTHTEDSTRFNADTLSQYGAVAFLSTSGDVLNAEQEAAFEEYVEGGGGYVGIHSASDTEYEWSWYGNLVGAYFQDHPEVQPATVVVEDRDHPSTQMLPRQWERTDEWYNFRQNPRGDVHVLMTLDESSYSGGEHGDDHPIAWCHALGEGGRAWYTGLGHTKESFREPLFREHVLGGLQWVLGTAEGECSVSTE